MTSTARTDTRPRTAAPRGEDLRLELPGNQHPAVLVPGLKRLLKGSWEQRRWFVLAVLGATGFALLQIATSAVIGRVTEEVIVPSFQRGEAVPVLILGGEIGRASCRERV